MRDETWEDVVISSSEKREAESSKKARVLGSEYLRLEGEGEVDMLYVSVY